MSEQANIDMTAESQTGNMTSGLVGFSARLAGADAPQTVFDTLAGFVGHERLGVLTLLIQAPGDGGRKERWTTLSDAGVDALDESRIESLIADLMPAGGRPAVIAWSATQRPGFHRVGDTVALEALRRGGIAGGMLAAMLLPSGRAAIAHATMDSEAIGAIADIQRDLFLVASIHTFLALDRRLGIIPPPDLTRRELETLRLSAQGMGIREIATAMNISQPTVKFHLQGARRKLNAKTTRAAVATLMREAPHRSSKINILI